jgi:hypothetical protein
MAGRMKHHEGGLSYFDLLTVGSNMSFEGWFGIRAVDYFCAGNVGKINVAGYKVGMEVRFQNVPDRCTIPVRLVDIRLYLAQRINYYRLTFGFNVIRALCKATRVYLFYFHGF